MFFFGIFGINQKQKEIKDITNRTCKSCGNLTVYKVIKTYMVFHIFFIPIFKWNEQYYIISRCCNSVFSIPKEKGNLIEKGNDVEILDSDMELIRRGNTYTNQYYNNTSGEEKLCPKCGKVVSPDYEYCPYCGEKLDSEK